MPDFSLEDAAHQRGHRIVAGVDEAGRGPWAGPVVAAAAVIDRERLSGELAAALDDSKKLKPEARAELFARLGDCAEVAVGVAEVAEIDAVNILQATMNAMARAVDGLAVSPDFVLVDGNRTPDLGGRAVETAVKGDGRSLSIAAASIVAKVTRDRLMAELAREHPGYGWESNAGYGTAAHQAALARLGVTPHHRRSFAPIRDLLEKK